MLVHGHAHRRPSMLRDGRISISPFDNLFQFNFYAIKGTLLAIFEYGYVINASRIPRERVSRATQNITIYLFIMIYSRIIII